MRTFISILFACCVPSSATTIAGLVGGQITHGDLTFSNFTVHTVDALDPLSPQTLNGTTFGPNTSLVPTTSDINVSLNGDGIQFDTGVVPPCGLFTGTFCVAGKNQSLMATIVYLVTSPTNFTSVDLFGSVRSHANTTTAAAYLDTCGTGVSASCLGVNNSAALLGVVNGANITLDGPVYLDVASTNRMWVRATIYLTTSDGVGSDAEFLAEAPLAAPEPATLGMMGLGLAGLGFLKLRRRRS